VSIEVLRKQKRATLSWKVPESERRFDFTPRTRRPREEPSHYRLVPKMRTAPVLAKVARAYRAI
jgi:hypothetical protein